MEGPRVHVQSQRGLKREEAPVTLKSVVLHLRLAYFVLALLNGHVLENSFLDFQLFSSLFS